MATDGAATIALEGLDDAARMKRVMLAVQHDAAAWLVDRIHANGTRRVLVPKDTILVCGVVDALHKRVYALHWWNYMGCNKDDTYSERHIVPLYAPKSI